MQNSKPISHEELFMAKSTMEELSAPYFLMQENLSKKKGPDMEKDLTVSLDIVWLEISNSSYRI